ncbi:hypothetical protein AA23498_2794 [Acetobacter nitrogenifigens DSM 23921 = NBRC 105050]|uniref:Uncharacterized protein n=2 Tax=Acetobacter nitrogenifigens TaxID=285268 RepID=A0A511XFK5_9PROT|nr:hypothetical protein [Acetobacter nitrogenifigens]GBQ97001.1 hypothetical protein AA23498_2794 [Acetobacter nitrogenifigens DSM 23921 = NBRC 105050]GEN61740.1 hypothetical protein ANI02nite_36240 [Acetobacter nitrogenifigens DSM 23921 = NBRC 105050]
MAVSGTFQRDIRLFVDKTLSPAALSRHLAEAAIAAREAVILSGDAPDSYTTFVDGMRGRAEITVRPDGVILYEFNYLPQAAIFCVEEAMRRSPARSGRYRRSWVVVVNGRVWSADLSRIAPGSEVMIVNSQPYARKIDTGAMRTIGRGVVEAVRQKALRMFPTLTVARRFVVIPPGLIDGAPWILRRSKGRARDRQAGQPITYPAIVLTEKI